MKFTPASDTAKQEVLEYAKEHLSVEDAKKILERQGYFVDNLWHVDDVTAWVYECDEDTAKQIMSKALTSEDVIHSVWDKMDYFSNHFKLKIKTK